MPWSPRDCAPPSLAEQLPYLHAAQHLGFGPLFLLADDSLGVIFEACAPACDTSDDGEEALSAEIATMLHAVPEGAHWQWFQVQTPDVRDALRTYQAHTPADALNRVFAQSLADRWLSAQTEGYFPGAGVNFHPRRHRAFIALKSGPLGLGKWSLADLLPTPAPKAVDNLLARLLAAWNSARHDDPVAAFVESAQRIQSAGESQGWKLRTLDTDELSELVSELLFPGWAQADRPGDPVTSSRMDPWWGQEEIRRAIAARGKVTRIHPSGFATESGNVCYHHRVVSMLWQPRAIRAGLINQALRDFPRISASLTASPHSLAASMLQLKARALLNARSTHRFNQAEMDARAQAQQDVETRMLADGERIFSARLQFHLADADPQAVDLAASRLGHLLASLGLEAAPEQEIGSSLLLRGCMPFAVFEESERKFRRRRRLLTRDCADLHPAETVWTGFPVDTGAITASRHPNVLYSNSLGQPLYIDPTRAEKNPHALVIGQSGSGKSFFVHDYLLHLWRIPGVRLFLISIKPDYRKLALLLGRYVEITLDSDISLNPFGGRPSREGQARWTAALAMMLADAGADAGLTRDAEILLQSASLAASQRNWDGISNQPLRETVLEHICSELENLGTSLARDLTRRLEPYRTGPFSRLFNAPRSVSASDRFVFFNLGSILRQPCGSLASYCVFAMVDEVMTDPSLKDVPKGLIADEVWAMVANPHAAAILDRALKAYRSLGGFALPIVQDPRDLDTPSGRVMLANTATKIILPLDASGQLDLDRYVRLNDREKSIVRSLHMEKRRYSEFFISMDGVHSAKGRLIPDALRYAVATTDPVDEARIDGILAEEGDMLSSLHRFAREFPFGVPTAGVRHQGWSRAAMLVPVALLALAGWGAQSALREPAHDGTQVRSVNEPAVAAMALLKDPLPLEIKAPEPANRTEKPVPKEAPAATPPSLSAMTSAREGSGGAPGRTGPDARIPDLIEGAQPSPALDALNIHSELRALEDSTVPFEVRAIEAHGMTPRVRLGLRGAPGKIDSVQGWLAPGDRFAPGWSLLRIDGDAVVVLSPKGNLLRIALPGKRLADPVHSGEESH